MGFIAKLRAKYFKRVLGCFYTTIFLLPGFRKRL